ncbi:hypothetical protein [Flavivirga spongiicola]|uniref:Uncharacterized protein n=1 Tax=Flavivirga spongiicola TaxID=421621 RepID=A0ABU7XNF9_9FLAO|nr:hypothetical protein [Flavivirga sp. MEBiC05379]MDO5977286.1 hypothetical protein [Flavivirga sp. MEBiC05379]
MNELTNEYMIYFSIGTVLNSIAHLTAIIASIIIVAKVKKTATYLMLLGSILKIIMVILSIVLPILTKTPESLLSLQGGISILTGLSLFVFALGFILYAAQLVKQNP